MVLRILLVFDHINLNYLFQSFKNNVNFACNLWTHKWKNGKESIDKLSVDPGLTDTPSNGKSES